MSQSCKYALLNGQRCGREADVSYCIFHTPKTDKNRKPDNVIKRQLVKLIKEKDGNWEGFVFPESLQLKNKSFDFPFYLNNSNLGAVTLENIKFVGNIEAKRSSINGPMDIQKCNCDNIIFDGSKFQEEVRFNQLDITRNYSISNCEFKARFEIRGRLNGVATFNGSQFHSRAIFSQYRNITMSVSAGVSLSSVGSIYAEISNPNWSIWKKAVEKVKKYKWRATEWLKRTYIKFINWLKSLTKSAANKVKVQTTQIRRRFPYEEEGVDESHLFYGQVNFSNVIFEKPSSVSFLHVNLARVSFENTDLKSVYFTGCNWYQTELRRNGIEQEYRNNSSDYHSRRLFQPRIESTCRNIRHALEDNKDFALANDFFIGEMEAKRKQLSFIRREFFSLLAWYKAFSKYGTSPLVCLRFIFLVGFAHAVLALPHLEIYEKINTTFLVDTNNYWELTKAWSNSIWNTVVELPKALVYSFQVMTLQKNQIITIVSPSDTLSVLNFVASIIGPALTLFLGLCIRTRIKRT